jgi:hypothetical protein
MGFTAAPDFLTPPAGTFFLAIENSFQDLDRWSLKFCSVVSVFEENTGRIFI